MGRGHRQSRRQVVHLPLRGDQSVLAREFSLSVRKEGADRRALPANLAEDPLALIKQIKATGMAAAMAISPATPAEVVTKEIANNLDMILVMTVVPGASHLLVFVQDVSLLRWTVIFCR